MIIAKANLTELARTGTTVSSLGGQTMNPYDLTRTPGGSSGGTGAVDRRELRRARDRQRHRAVDSLAGLGQQPGRRAAHARPDQPRRRDADQPDPGRNRTDHAHRATTPRECSTSWPATTPPIR